MGVFSELIKNFEKTRDYLRDFFVYGYKTRGDFGLKSTRTYDDERRRAESWLGGYVTNSDSPRGRQTAIVTDSSRLSVNPLYNAYYSKSFTDNDIKLHFFILDILSDSDGGSLSLREILTALDENFGEYFEEQTVRNKLREYVEEGILRAEKRGRAMYFSLEDCNAEKLFSEYDGLENAVKFYSMSQEFGVIGDSILKSADLENDVFSMKHNYIVHTLEDYILTEIIKAMDNKNYISFESFSSRSRTSQPTVHRETDIVPLRILSSSQTGRRYMSGYSTRFKKFTSFRLDYMRSVKTGEVCKDYDRIFEKYLSSEKRTFGVSFGSSCDGSSGVQPLKITFYIDEISEKFVIDRLEREKRCGTVSHPSENIFVLSLSIDDCNEPMGWLKTFTGRILSVEGGNSCVRDRFYSDMKKMFSIYK